MKTSVQDYKHTGRWTSPDEPIRDRCQEVAEEMRELSNEFHKTFIEVIGNSYPFTDTPGPDVLHVRDAIFKPKQTLQ